MRSRDYQWRQGRGMLFACGFSLSGLAKSKHGGKTQADAHAPFERAAEISKLRDRARGSDFSARRTGHGTGWLSSESLLETRVSPGHLQAASDAAQECVQDIHRSLVTCPHVPQAALVRQKPSMPGLQGGSVVMWLTLPPSQRHSLSSDGVGRLADERKEASWEREGGEQS